MCAYGERAHSGTAYGVSRTMARDQGESPVFRFPAQCPDHQCAEHLSTMPETAATSIVHVLILEPSFSLVRTVGHMLHPGYLPIHTINRMRCRSMTALSSTHDFHSLINLYGADHEPATVVNRDICAAQCCGEVCAAKEVRSVTEIMVEEARRRRAGAAPPGGCGWALTGSGDRRSSWRLVTYTDANFYIHPRVPQTYPLLQLL